ncbi:unnamed protein product [Lactuca virosa]|uniref:RecA-like N-terminal domain-containing protein n=1 Tax=Lactuca virosa TaxID=75947 RepID=A0AAU9MX61_9ASTR|nr:unnamed protein product [Lactuca virosa]
MQPPIPSHPALPPVAPPTVQTAEVSNVPIQQRAVIGTLTRLFNETSEALGGANAVPTKASGDFATALKIQVDLTTSDWDEYSFWKLVVKQIEASDLEDDKLHDDIKAAEKHTALHSALSELAGDFDGESMLFLQRFFRTRVKPVVSIGSLKLDLALGIGGLPKGRIVELGGYYAYLDVENALDPLLLETVGVNTKSLLISQPNSAENLLSTVDTLTQSGVVDVIVIDSVDALIPQREITGVISDNIIETQSRIMTRALRKILYSLCRSETLIIFINQVR